MKSSVKTALILCAGALTIFPALAVDDHAPAEDLTPKLRHFLQKEMRALAHTGRELEAALQTDDVELVQKHAAQMHEEFIFEDEITTFDLRVLKATLGDEFVDMDKEFHSMARELEGTSDPAAQKVIFSSMLQVCAACHSAYAPEAPLLEE